MFLVVIVGFLIPTGLVLASQNAVPGDSTYSIKRSLEKVILSLASLHPSTKAYFHADLMNRRYKEAVALIEKGANASESLQELVAQTSSAAQIAHTLSNKKQKAQYIDQLSKSIDQYEIKLSQIEERVAPLPLPTPTPQEPTTQPTLVASSAPTIEPSEVPSVTFIASPKPSPEIQPSPTVSPHPPTPIPSTEPSPTFQPQPIYQTPPVKPELNEESKRKDIDEAKRKLKEIKRRLDDEKKELEAKHDNRKVSLEEEREKKGKKEEQKSLKDKEKD